LTEYFVFFVPALIVFGLYLYIQLEEYRKRIRFLEVRIDALIKHAGIEFNDTTFVPVEVHNAIKAGHRLKAIRLYRKITGADLEEASEVVDGLVKNT
jgi:ribosomal protein L7/L12